MLRVSNALNFAKEKVLSFAANPIVAAVIIVAIVILISFLVFNGDLKEEADKPAIYAKVALFSILGVATPVLIHSVAVRRNTKNENRAEATNNIVTHVNKSITDTGFAPKLESGFNNTTPASDKPGVSGAKEDTEMEKLLNEISLYE